MKATGVRRLDDLGRIVIPKEIRRSLQIREGETLEIFVNRSGEIILKKYSPIADIATFVQQYAEAMNGSTHKNILIVDRETIIAVAGELKNKYLNRRVSQSLIRKIEEGISKLDSEKDLLEAIEGDTTEGSFAMNPITLNGDPIGAVIIMAIEENEVIHETDIIALKVAAQFLEKYLEG